MVSVGITQGFERGSFGIHKDTLGLRLRVKMACQAEKKIETENGKLNVNKHVDIYIYYILGVCWVEGCRVKGWQNGKYLQHVGFN